MKTSSLLALVALSLTLFGCATHSAQRSCAETTGKLGLAGQPNTTFDEDVRQLMEV